MTANCEKVQEIDILERIKNGRDDDFLIDLDVDIRKNELGNGLLFRNGIVIMLCKSDNGMITVDGKEYQLSRNNVIVLPENHIINNISLNLIQEHCIIATSVDYILNMPSPIDTSIFSYSRYMSVIRIAEEKFDDLENYYRFIYKESMECGKYRTEIIRSIFYALILEILAEYEKIFNTQVEASKIKANNLSDDFFRLLAIHYKERHSVRFYADTLNLTPKYLSTAIKRTTGRPILEWIHEALIIDAKMLLRTTDLTVQEVSEQLNFSSPSAFVQFFKKHTGKTPRKI
ncbi:MAG: AraC family transcriptional regulator [Bacteroidaceae bacterium]|nr:AraC family transcriptional regulator [Bacteroidaceae bacterium]